MSESPTRIAVLTPYWSTDYIGGIEVFNRQLRTVLGELEVFANPASVARAPTGPLGRVGLAQPYRALLSARSFWRKHRARPFSLVISNGLYGWPLAFGREEIPAVQVYHFTMAGLARRALALRGDRVTTRTVSAFFDRLAGRGKHVVAVSGSVLDELRAYYGLGGQVIPNGVDTDLFKRENPIQARETLGLPREGSIGLFVGRPEYAKGYDIFLEVARSLPEVTFVVVGHPSRVEPNVRVLENIPHTKMPVVYSASDFLFLPSRYEGFGLSILEALACELPFVVSAAAYNLAEDPNRYGRVVASLRPAAFVDAIEELLARDASYRESRTLAANYGLDVFRKNWRELVVSLLAGSIGSGVA